MVWEIVGKRDVPLCEKKISYRYSVDTTCWEFLMFGIYRTSKRDKI